MKKFKFKKETKKEISALILLAVFFLTILILFFSIMVCLSTNTANAQETNWIFKGEIEVKIEGKIKKIKNSEKWERKDLDVQLITVKNSHQVLINTEDREIQVDCIKDNFSVKLFKTKNDFVKRSLKNTSLTEEDVADLKNLSTLRKRKPNYIKNMAFEFLLKKLENNCGKIEPTKK